MEEVVKRIANYASTLVEMVAVAVIILALLQFLFSFVQSRVSRAHHITNTWLRVRFGSALTLALELLLAADILATAVAPTWDDIGKLAAIAAIRTTLNYFLEKELKDIEQRAPAGAHPPQEPNASS